MNNLYRQTFTIKTTNTTLPLFIFGPDFRLKGFITRAEAEDYLDTMEKEPGYKYSVVYVREYFNRAKDPFGNYSMSTAAEIQEPEA